MHAGDRPIKNKSTLESSRPKYMHKLGSILSHLKKTNTI
jgi:hypothetical protein